MKSLLHKIAAIQYAHKLALLNTPKANEISIEEMENAIVKCYKINTHTLKKYNKVLKRYGVPHASRKANYFTSRMSGSLPLFVYK